MAGCFCLFQIICIIRRCQLTFSSLVVLLSPCEFITAVVSKPRRMSSLPMCCHLLHSYVRLLGADPPWLTRVVLGASCCMPDFRVSMSAAQYLCPRQGTLAGDEYRRWACQLPCYLSQCCSALELKLPNMLRPVVLRLDEEGTE